MTFSSPLSHGSESLTTESREHAPEADHDDGGARVDLTRRSVLRTGATVAGAIGLGGIGFAGRGRAGSSSIPSVATYYGVRMVGQSPNESFDRQALLLVTPPVDKTGATQVNARDVALRSGSPPSSPEAGAIWYATNTALYNAVDIPATETQRNAQLDVAVVEADENQGLLQIQPDANLARAAQLNVFTARTSLFAGIFNVTGGVVQLEFQGGNQISGAMDLVGVAPTGAASDRSRLVAQFAGTVTQAG